MIGQNLTPHRRLTNSPLAIFFSLWEHRELIWQMVKRDVIGRYRGSLVGLAWSFFNPILMLLVYTIVFSVVFKARWGGGLEESKADFAMTLFTGMIVHGLFAECVNRAPGLILSNVNYVKKVLFPLEVLPWIALGSALFHASMNLLVLMLFYFVANLSIPPAILLLPVLFLPLALLTIGVSWILASLGVYIRDIGHMMAMLTTIMLFLSPVFYPASALPEPYRAWLYANPLTFIIEQARNLVFWGGRPDWIGLAAYFVVSCLVAWVGLIWFQRTRKGFADVL